MKLSALIQSIDRVLGPQTYHDSSYNGLQVEGKSEIRQIITAVSACQEVFDTAVQKKADAVLVHHGLYWEHGDPLMRGYLKKRITTLLKNDISLLAYHLPLDAHKTLGNNAQICKMLHIQSIKPWGLYDSAGITIGFSGALKTGLLFENFVTKINTELQTKSILLPFGPRTVHTIAVVSGGAGLDFLNQAVIDGVDMLITGELQEPMYHYAKEAGIHVVGAGHYATERWGVKALGNWIQKKYEIKCTFVDVENPL